MNPDPFQEHDNVSSHIRSNIENDDHYDNLIDVETVPFFADAILDINEARGIAMTPDITSNHRVLGLNYDNNDTAIEKDIGIMEQIKHISLPDIVTNKNHNKNDTLESNAPPPILSKEQRQTHRQTLEIERECNEVTTNPSSFSFQHRAYRPKLPTRPRDKKWIFAYAISMPLIFLPLLRIVLFQSSNDNSHRLQLVNIPLFICLVLTLLMTKILYTSRRGDDGEDQRLLVGQILIVSNATSCFILPLLTFTIYYLNIEVTKYSIITFIGLIGMTLREIYIFAKLNKSGFILSEGVNDSERAFFRILVNTSLDILSRSFQSFYRTVAILLILQFMILTFLRMALEYSLLYQRWKMFWICMIVVVGYWSVTIVNRFLAYLSCGGITLWFAQQSILVKESEQMRSRKEGDYVDNNKKLNANAHGFIAGIEYDPDFDVIGSNDNFGDLGRESHRTSELTFVQSGTGVSLGSIIHCALTGDLARFIWVLTCTIDDFVSKSKRSNMLISMSVGEETDSWISTIRARLKSFVRNNNDLALCYVAAYYSSYTRAANDVMSSIELSGE
jgi:hypothetical protein